MKAYKLFADQPDWFTLNSSAYQNAVTNSKRVIADISAAYVRFDLKLLQNRANLTGGLRYERTALDGWSRLKDSFAIYQRDARGNLSSDGRGGFLRKTTDATELIKLQFIERGSHESRAYDGPYPSANFNYAFNDNLVAREAYARTIRRPDVRYVFAGITLPVPTDTNETTARTIVVGNHGLEPWTADSLQRWENAGAARLSGVEASYRQDLWFVPSWLKVMQVCVNYTHLQVSGENEEDFVGFTPDILSFGVNYIRSRFSLRLTRADQAEAWNSYIQAVPGTSNDGFIPPRTYGYQAAATQYGVSAEYAFTKRLSLYLDWNNVFAEDLFVYRRAPDTPKYAQNAQRYVMPSSIMLGVRGCF